MFSNNTDSFIKVPDEIVEKTFSLVQDNYTGEPFGKLEWEAAKRQMERDQGEDYKQ